MRTRCLEYLKVRRADHPRHPRAQLGSDLQRGTNVTSDPKDHDSTDLRVLIERLGRLCDLLEKGARPSGTDDGVRNFQTEVLPQMLSRQDVMACLLQNISDQTCSILNEAHWQTELQRAMRDALLQLLELSKAAHPDAALHLERVRELTKRLEECCPAEKPEPVCKPRPCEKPGTPSEGSSDSHTVRVIPIRVSGAQFPPFEMKGEPLESRNEDIVPRVPIGPLRGSFAPVLPSINLLRLTSDPDEARGQGAAGNPVIFDTDTPFGNVVTFSGVPPDMSGAMNDDVVFMTGNTFAALSTNGGATFTNLNPTTIFPSGPTNDAAGNPLDKGLCCDQVIQYAPSIDRFIWLMQFCGTGSNCLQGINKLRIAFASTQDVRSSGGTTWTYFDVSSGLLNLGRTTMDYPDMSIGSNFLHVSADAVGSGLLVFRVPLAQLLTGGTIDINYTTPSDSALAYGGHITQNTGDMLMWAGHFNTSRMRVFNWPENSGQYSWRDIDINSWPNSDYTSQCPDNT